MTQGTKFYYETVDQRARIQFFTDDVLINEWVAHDDLIDVPISPGAIVYRKDWKAALLRIRSWIAGIPTAGINFSQDKAPSFFRARILHNNSGLNAVYRVRDIYDSNYIVRELNYDVNVDKITLSERLAASSIYWVDYLSFINLQDTYEQLVDNVFMGGL